MQEGSLRHLDPFRSSCPRGNGVIGDVAPAAAWASFLPIFTSHLGARLRSGSRRGRRATYLSLKHQTWLGNLLNYKNYMVLYGFLVFHFFF